MRSEAKGGAWHRALCGGGDPPAPGQSPHPILRLPRCILNHAAGLGNQTEEQEQALQDEEGPVGGRRALGGSSLRAGQAGGSLGSVARLEFQERLGEQGSLGRGWGWGWGPDLGR